MEGLVHKQFRPSADPVTPGQGGFSLIEVLIAIMLVGMVVVSLAAGLTSIMRANRVAAERQVLTSAAGNFSESLKASAYRPCDGPEASDAAGYQTAYDAWVERWNPPAGVDAEIVRVEYWHRDSDSFEDDCPDGGAADHGSQRLTVEVQYSGREKLAQLVKRER